MILAPFRLHRPETLAEALELARDFGDDFDYIAGGTDLLQNYKNRLNVKDHVIALEHVKELRGVTAKSIGAMERLNDVAGNAVVKEHWPGLAGAIASIASPLIRNSGTIGGNLLVDNRCYYFNQTPFWRDTKGSCMKAESDVCLVVPQKEICYAAYSGDLAPILLVMNATLDLASPKGTRTLSLREFFQGDGIERNQLGDAEILVSIGLPKDAATIRSGYRKLRHRDTMDYPEMGVAAALGLSGGNVTELRLATTAVDVVPQFFDFTERFAGQPLDDVMDMVAAEAEEHAKPKKNTSMPVGYRKKMVRVYLRRLLRDLANGREVPTG